MANELQLKHSEDEIISTFETDERAALSLIVDNVNGITKAEDLFKMIGKSAMIGRAQWVQTAIVTAKAFENKSRAEVAETREKWAEVLRYSKQQIANFRQAGEKLISGDFEKIPNTMAEFLKRPSNQKAEFKSVSIVRRAGEYLDGDGKLHMEQCGLASYMHGEYFAPGKKVGSFGYSVKKRSKRTPEQQGKGRKNPAKKK